MHLFAYFDIMINLSLIYLRINLIILCLWNNVLQINYFIWTLISKYYKIILDRWDLMLNVFFIQILVVLEVS